MDSDDDEVLVESFRFVEEKDMDIDDEYEVMLVILFLENVLSMVVIFFILVMDME